MKIALGYSILIFLLFSFVEVSVSGDDSDGGMMNMKDKEGMGDHAGKMMGEGMKKKSKTGRRKKKKSSKEDCVVKDVLQSMTDVIKSLNQEIQEMKMMISDRCSDFLSDGGVNETDNVDSSVENLDVSLESLNETMSEDASEVEDEEMDEEDLLPPIPSECPAPFQPVGSGCFYFLYYPKDWKSWGESNSFCQTLGGTLAAPVRPEALRTYLKDNFSNVFWVGARRSTNSSEVSFEWIDGSQVSDDEWKEGQPKQPAAKFCIYWEYFPGYKAVNHYCGEKFAFICEYREKDE